MTVLFDNIKQCISEIEIRMLNGESKEQAFKNAIYLEDLNKHEREYIDNYFK